MASRLPLSARALIGGTVASITSAIALAVAARYEGQAAVRPINATSHWRHGPAAADIETVDMTHTGIGYATHHAATVFWAALYEASRARNGRLGLLPAGRDVAIIATVAAAADYLATPKRFTPGWELVLSKSSMAFAYVAMGAGLVLSAVATDRNRSPATGRDGRPRSATASRPRGTRDAGRRPRSHR